MRRHELVRGFCVFMLFPTLGEHVFFLRLQHWKLADLVEIPAETAAAGNCR